MKRLYLLAAAALLGGAAAGAEAGVFCCKEPCCKPYPEAPCPDCTPPCQRHHHCSARKSERAHKLLEELCSPECCARIKAAHKLGHRLHADFCCDCDIVPALLKALLCDPCWEVRRAAAWSLALQGARTEPALVGLYISSRLDRHYMVRDRAIEALDILTLCRKPCYKELFKAADALVGQLRKDSIRPGVDNCVEILATLDHIGPVPAPAAVEAIPAPVVPGTPLLRPAR